MKKFLMVVFVFFCLVVRVEGEGQVKPIIPVIELEWQEVKGIPGASHAFFLRLPNESCLAVFLDTPQGGELRFSTGKIGSGKDVVIKEEKGRVIYANGTGKGSVKPHDPAFVTCVERVKTSTLFTPELKARFLGFGGIK